MTADCENAEKPSFDVGRVWRMEIWSGWFVALDVWLGGSSLAGNGHVRATYILHWIGRVCYA
jgi:hypothetical protein